MIRFFKEEIAGNPSILLTGKENYIFGRLEEKLSTMQLNLRRSNYTVRSDHLLVQILQNLDTLSYSGHEDIVFYNSLITQAENIASSMDITSLSHVQRNLRKPQFYNAKGLKEYYLNTPIGYPRSIDSKRNWMFFQPVRVMTHPFADLSMNIKNGTLLENPNEKDILNNFVVVMIDIPLLGIQYRRWRESVAHLEAQPTTMQFVMQFPIANLLVTDTTVAYANFYRAQLGLVSEHQQKRNYTWGVNDVMTYVDDQTHKVVEQLVNRSTNPVDILKVIPVPFSSTLWKFLQCPTIRTTSQNLSILALGYLPWLIFTYTVMDLQSSKDKSFSVQLKHRIEQYFNIGIFNNIPGINKKELKEELDSKLIRYL